MERPLDELLSVLEVERLDADLFRGRNPGVSFQRVFGGQVAGQAITAAARTVDSDRGVHSLHSYFLRPGDPTVPIVYRVDPARDGRSFTTRRVTATQRGEVIFVLSASFQRAEPGYDHQVAMPAAPPPEECPSREDLLAPYREQVSPALARTWPVEVRYASGSPWAPRAGREAVQHVWVRSRGTLPDDPVVHVAVVTFASDMTLLDTTIYPHGAVFEDFLGAPQVQAASLDHAMWFHRPFRADEWLLYAQESPTASGARGLALGRFFAQDGRLVASVVQEGLIRPVHRPADPGESVVGSA